MQPNNFWSLWNEFFWTYPLYKKFFEVVGLAPLVGAAARAIARAPTCGDQKGIPSQDTPHKKSYGIK